jgi:hypothetical protein
LAIRLGTDDEDGGREADLFLTFEVVGGRAAFDVDRAVLDQRDAVGRGDRHQAGVDLGQLQLSS